MDNIKNDAYYVEKILIDIDFILLHMENVSKTEFSANEVLQDSMMFRLVQISENAGKLTEEFKAANGKIPWGDISGLRNRIVHDYGNVDLTIVYDTLTNDVPYLKKTISGTV